MAPVVMVAVGLQWHLRLERQTAVPLAAGLILKLAVVPALVLGVFIFLGLDSLAAHTVVLQAGMPVMVTAGILAISQHLAPRLVARLVGYGLLPSGGRVAVGGLLVTRSPA